MIQNGSLRDGRVSRITKNRDDKSIDRNIDTLKEVLTSIDFLKNFECELAQNILCDPGVETEISHRLNAVPRFKIVVRQNGNGLIIDGSTVWNTSKIYLYNSGASTQTISVLIFK